MNEKLEDMLMDLLDILHALPVDEIVVPKHSGYNVGCNDWTGKMIYERGLDILDAVRKVGDDE